MNRVARVDLTKAQTPGYQRPIDTQRVNSFARKFNRNQVSPPTLSERDEHLWIVDGQHTIAILAKMGITEWECVILHGLTYEEEARLYADRNSNRTRRALNPYDHFKALLEAEDTEAQHIYRIAKDLDLYFPFEGGDIANIRCLTAIQSCFAIYRRSPQALALVLRVATRAWPTQKRRFHNQILRGLAEFLATHPNADEKRLTNKLTTVSPSALIAEALTLHQLQGLRRPLAMAERIVAVYDKGLKTDGKRLRAVA